MPPNFSHLGGGNGFVLTKRIIRTDRTIHLDRKIPDFFVLLSCHSLGKFRRPLMTSLVVVVVVLGKSYFVGFSHEHARPNLVRDKMAQVTRSDKDNILCDHLNKLHTFFSFR